MTDWARCDREAQERLWAGNTPSCDLCGGEHGSDHDCQNHDHANEDASCSPDCEACKDTQPHPFDVMAKRGAAIRKHGHTTQSTEVETIDITPVGCQTPEGQSRVQIAHQEWDDATHALANTLKEIMDDDEKPTTDDIQQLRALIGARDRKQEAFLRAVAGK